MIIAAAKMFLIIIKRELRDVYLLSSYKTTVEGEMFKVSGLLQSASYAHPRNADFSRQNAVQSHTDASGKTTVLPTKVGVPGKSPECASGLIPSATSDS